jgi:hypothetical protein
MGYKSILAIIMIIDGVVPALTVALFWAPWPAGAAIIGGLGVSGAGFRLLGKNRGTW